MLVKLKPHATKGLKKINLAKKKICIKTVEKPPITKIFISHKWYKL